MERTRDPLRTLQRPQNRQLWCRRFNGWVGIMLDGRAPLHVFERGFVTDVRYKDDNIIDDSSPHRALLVDEFLESEDIRRMDWLVRSPDLNPIENVWDALRRAIVTRNPPQRTIQEMKTALLSEWCQLPHKNR
ncbi:DDE_3 domain-containing protein [Trichonephila clavipes]|uniref:DDE_3 domain-containing protein n=1 Tax=Trichonephila clavipes TaxID=2585209 RepID=A0A8X6VIP0_TRICX|nr:DDE_3 domain-containing protein [Trichonephila clavipes]